MEWFRKWRVLVVAYSLASAFAIREVIVSRSRGPVEWPKEEWSRMVEIVREINPEEADTDWLLSMEALKDGSDEEFVLRLEEALATDIKHNEYLLQDYAQLMLDRGADYQLANWAANRWRENHPFSAQTLRLALSAGPADEAEESYLVNQLVQVPWIGGAELEPYMVEGTERWRVLISFRPAEDVDVRQAIEAVSMLTLSEEQRASFRVRCRSLMDCSMVPRQ